MGETFSGFLSGYFNRPGVPVEKLDNFDLIAMIGRGSYGRVFRARKVSDDRVVALKQVTNIRGNAGHHESFYRELWSLSLLDHPHVIKMYSGFTEGIHGFISMENMRCDLAKYITEFPNGVGISQTKQISHQLFNALSYCHLHTLMHRDVKPSNILVDELFNIKLADFGLSRDTIMTPGPPFSSDVVTLMYRPPEILFGSTVYSFSADVWSAGCIVYELLMGKTLFDERTRLDVAKRIFEVTGTPTEENWPGVEQFRYYDIFWHDIGLLEGTHFANISQKWVAGFEFLNRIIVNPPYVRLSAKDAMDHPLFNH